MTDHPDLPALADRLESRAGKAHRHLREELDLRTAARILRAVAAAPGPMREYVVRSSWLSGDWLGYCGDEWHDDAPRPDPMFPVSQRGTGSSPAATPPRTVNDHDAIRRLVPDAPRSDLAALADWAGGLARNAATTTEMVDRLLAVERILRAVAAAPGPLREAPDFDYSWSNSPEWYRWLDALADAIGED